MIKNKFSIGKVIYISAAVALVASFLILVLEKSQVINLYSKPISDEIIENPYYDSAEEVDYSPADPTYNDSINEQKESGGFESENTQQTEPGAPVNVVLTAATQDTTGGPVVVRVLINNATSGTCNISFSKDSVVKEYSLNVSNAGTYYNCDALDIPASELSAGEWNLQVNVTSGDRSGAATSTVEVKL